MSAIVTLRVTGDPAVFEEQAATQADTIARIMEVAKSHGLTPTAGMAATASSWSSTNGPTERAFHAFFRGGPGGDRAPSWRRLA